MRDDQNDYYYRRRQANGGDTFFAFMTGLMVGTVAALMTNRDTREKVQEALNGVKKKGQKMVAETTRRAHEATKELGENARELADTVSEKAERVAAEARKDGQKRQGRG